MKSIRKITIMQMNCFL